MDEHSSQACDEAIGAGREKDASKKPAASGDGDETFRDSENISKWTGAIGEGSSTGKDPPCR